MPKLKVQRDRGGPGSERRVQDREGKGKAASRLVQEAKRAVAIDRAMCRASQIK